MEAIYNYKLDKEDLFIYFFYRLADSIILLSAIFRMTLREGKHIHKFPIRITYLQAYERYLIKY